MTSSLAQRKKSLKILECLQFQACVVHITRSSQKSRHCG